MKNAKIAQDAENIVFSFAGYAITRSDYLDIAVKANAPTKIKIDATMYIIEADALATGDDDEAIKVRTPKKGITEVTITGNTTILDPDDLGFIDVTASPSIIAIGESTTLSAQLYDENRDLDLTDGIDLSVVTPLAQGPLPSVNGHATFATYTPTTPGLKILAGNAEDYTPDDPNTLAVVEVVELCPDRGTIVEPPSGGSSGGDPDDPDIPYCYIEIDEDYPVVTIIAKPNIPLPEEKLPTSWTLRKGEDGQAVPYAGGNPNDTRDCITIDALTPGEYLIIAQCGTSECKMCFVIFEAPSVEIFVDSPLSDTDDLVQLYSQFPPVRFRTNCSIRYNVPIHLEGQTPALTVTLTSQNGRVHFHDKITNPEPAEENEGEGDPNAPDPDANPEGEGDGSDEEEPEPPDPGTTTYDITIPPNGQLVYFSISGEDKSLAVDDAVIEAYDRFEGDAAPEGAIPLATQDLTVFWFEHAELNITPNRPYELYNDGEVVATSEGVNVSASVRQGTLVPEGLTEDDVAVSFEVSATLQPEGLDTTELAFFGFRVGMIQVVNSYQKKRTYAGRSDTVTFFDNADLGLQIDLPRSVDVVVGWDDPVSDSGSAESPLYGVSSSHLPRPLGYPAGTAFTITDTPTARWFASLYQYEFPAPNGSDEPIGRVTYEAQIAVSYKVKFTVWSVVYNTITHEYICIRSRDWEIDFVQEGEESVSSMPIIGELHEELNQSPVDSAPYANSRITDIDWVVENTIVTGVGTETDPFINE